MKEINYLSAIVSGDRSGITQMYAALFPAIRRLVQDNGGSEDDAKDVFQDAVIVLYEKAQKPDFQLTSKFSTLLYGVCHNLWRSRRQKKSNSELTIPDDAKYIADDSHEIDLLQIERNKLFYKALRHLGKDCQILLELFFQKLSMNEIAQAMGFASEGYARVRKSQCKDRLVELIKSDAEFPELQTA
ncbi:MAG: sigma-70 family RNA polymerase sigma factor [Phycisphaerae bacterium]|nr:sigma-70 family RNA polymerase sigma factor [Saprospiraceae bacterium]